MKHTGTDILKIFHSAFPGKADLYFAPGRINLLGEHIDYNSGYVMPAQSHKVFGLPLAKQRKMNFLCTVQRWMNIYMEIFHH